MRFNKIIKYFFGVIFLFISLYNYTNYLDFYNSLNEPQKIKYLFVSKKINIGGRGNSYEMIINYKNKLKTISLTSKEYTLIDIKNYPILYEGKRTGYIFSKWVVKKSLRISILFFLMFVVAVSPWNKVLYCLSTIWPLDLHRQKKVQISEKSPTSPRFSDSGNEDSQ
jgi:hypothetical protein